jgi:ribosomal protein S27AE
LDERHGVKHSVEYISALWKNKIPKLISEQAKEDWLLFHFTNEVKGKWKKCSRCGEVKLAHHRFFSRNKTSKDGYYSICKSCRNKKRG